MRMFIYGPLLGALALGAGALIAVSPVAYAGEVTEEHRTYQEEHSETIHQPPPAVERHTTETTVKSRARDNDDDNDNDNRGGVDVKVKTKHD